MDGVQIASGAGGTGPHPMARTRCVHDVALNVPCPTCFRNSERMKFGMLIIHDQVRRMVGSNG